MGRLVRNLKRLILIICALVCIAPRLVANGNLPKSIRIYPEVEGFWFLDGFLDFGCEVTYINGGKRRTAGYLNGNLPWKELVCQSDQAIFHGDRMIVDLFKVRQNNNTLVVNVHMRDFTICKSTYEIKIPPLQSLRVIVPDPQKARYGSVIEPYVSLSWANGVSYTYKCSDPKSMIPRDSVELFFNSTRVFDGKVHLPAFNMLESHTFSLSALWSGKPWLYDIQVYPYRGKEHAVWKFETVNGADARKQSPAPKGMDGAEGFHGLPGSDAEEVTLKLYMRDDKKKLIVEATNGTSAFRKEFSPDEFSLELIVRGGNGGDGGKGGEGGSAPFDNPSGAGIGGKGGSGGRGGKGAVVSITASPESESFIPCIIVDNADGASGKPGKGGRGGQFSSGYGVPTLLDLLFPTRNYDGDPGENY